MKYLKEERAGIPAYGVLGDCGFQLSVLMLSPRTTDDQRLALNERLNKS